MAKKEFHYKGKTLEELQQMGLKEFIDLLPARLRRSLKRGLSHRQKKLMERVEAGSQKLRTHARDLAILPAMVGKTVSVYNGKEFVNVHIQPEMIGHVFGEFAESRKRVAHNAPGIGATKSSAGAATAR